MDIDRRSTQTGIAPLVQRGFIGTVVLSVLPLLIVALFVAFKFPGEVFVPIIGICVVAWFAVCVGIFILYNFVQAKLEKRFQQWLTTVQLYRQGEHSRRLDLPNDSLTSELLSEWNGILDRYQELALAVRQPQQASFPNAVPPQQPLQGPSQSLVAVVSDPGSEPGSGVGGVQKAVARVMKETWAMVDRASILERATLAQSIQIFQTTESVEGISQTTQQLLKDAQDGSERLQDAFEHVRKGQEMLHDTLKGLPRLQRETQNAAQKMYKVGEHSLAISELIQNMHQIVEQMHVISVHPLMQVVQAGQLAPELTDFLGQVQLLAVSTVEAALRMAQHIEAVEAETRQAIVSLQKSAQTVSQEVEHADNADFQLQGLYELMERVSGLMEGVVTSAREQAEAVDTAARSMSQIAEVTYQTTRESQSNIQGMRSLASLSEQLQSSVARIGGPQKPPALPAPEEERAYPSEKTYDRE